MARETLKRFSFLICLVGLAMTASAQVSNDPALLIKNSGRFSYIDTYQPDPKIEGDYLLTTEPFPMTLYLAPTKDPFKVEGGNLNLLDFSVLIDFESNTYAVQPLFVDSVFMRGKWLINTRHIQGVEKPNELFFVMHRGKALTLFKEQRMELLAPTWVEALQVGNRNYTLQSRTRYFCVDRQGNSFDVTKNINDFKKGDQFSDLKKFYKGQSLDFKEEKDLVRFVDYADSIWLP